MNEFRRLAEKIDQHMQPVIDWFEIPVLDVDGNRVGLHAYA